MDSSHPTNSQSKLYVQPSLPYFRWSALRQESNEMAGVGERSEDPSEDIIRKNSDGSKFTKFTAIWQLSWGVTAEHSQKNQRTLNQKIIINNIQEEWEKIKCHYANHIDWFSYQLKLGRIFLKLRGKGSLEINADTPCGRVLLSLLLHCLRNIWFEVCDHSKNFQFFILTKLLLICFDGHSRKHPQSESREMYIRIVALVSTHSKNYRLFMYFLIIACFVVNLLLLTIAASILAYNSEDAF